VGGVAIGSRNSPSPYLVGDHAGECKANLCSCCTNNVYCVLNQLILRGLLTKGCHFIGILVAPFWAVVLRTERNTSHMAGSHEIL
jgi:hypothetical protein